MVAAADLNLGERPQSSFLLDHFELAIPV